MFPGQDGYSPEDIADLCYYIENISMARLAVIRQRRPLQNLGRFCGKSQLPAFTFHYGEIKTNFDISLDEENPALHSTMVRLKPAAASLFKRDVLPLHSTMVRLKPILATLVTA